MLKFFRKYNKIILGVGFALLMVIFLLPQGVSRLVGDPRQRTAFAYDGGRITEEELIQANADLQFLEAMYPPLVKIYLGLDQRRGGLHWALLVHLAEDAGYVGGPDDGRTSLDEMARTFSLLELRNLFGSDYARINSQKDSLAQSMLIRFEQARAGAINNGRPDEAVDRVLARVRGVLRLYSAYLNTVTLSDRELARAVRDAYAQATVDAAQIPAAGRVDEDTPEPTELEILSAFDQFKNVRRGEGEHGFGYLREPAVRLEWMLISRRDIEQAVTLDPVEVNAYWRAHRDRFTSESFAEDRPRVEREIRDAEVERVLAEVRRAFKGIVLQNTSRFEPGPDGTPVPPADWAQQRPLFIDMAKQIEARVEERTGVDIPPPDTLSDPRWLSRDQTAALPVIGNARIVIGRQTVALPDVVYSLPTLGGDNSAGLIEGVAYTEPLIAEGGTLCFIRVNTARPESPPESVAEVRPLIVNDLKTLFEYEELAGEVSALEQSILEKGFNDAMRDYGVNTILSDVAVTRDQFGRTISASEEDAATFRNAVMDRVGRLDATVPVVDQPIADRVVVQGMPSALAVVGAVITEQFPVTIEAYQTLAAGVFGAARNRIQNIGGWPFRFDALIDRFHVVGVNRSLTDEDEDLDQAPAQGDTPPAG